ncbi:MAG: hypothetical protein UW96_C0019G0005 [Candidatus Collierbacteria bacterium GW2011_GWA1_45_15]|nr:MAG: hypothetical protein UW96_C0019G0005 [Candidatus Collierbacteria bacterium GW2011_GWA1_45_15]
MRSDKAYNNILMLNCQVLCLVGGYKEPAVRRVGEANKAGKEVA